MIQPVHVAFLMTKDSADESIVIPDMEYNNLVSCWTEVIVDLYCKQIGCISERKLL
jgi:hypothetical protein